MTKFFARLPLCSFLFFAISVAAQTNTDAQIQFWKSRLQRDPYDYISPTKLGAACLQKARESGDLDFYFQAEEALKTALARNPEHVTAQALLASVFVAQHKFTNAISLAEKTIKALPDEPFAHGILGDALLEIGNVTKAETVYKKLGELDSGLFTHSRMANLKWLRGNISGALESFGKAIEAGERDGAPLENLAWCNVQQGGIYFRTGEFKKAEARYEAALKLMPDYYLALDHIAELRAAETKYDEAVKLYQKLIERVPRPEFQHALGDVYAFAGKSVEAKRWHERALASYLKAATNGQIHYYHHLASFYSDVEVKPAEALKWARRDLEVRQNVFAYDGLAWALYRDGQFAAALEAIKKALAIGTKDEHLLTHAGMIHVRAGKFDEGKKFLHEADAINPRNTAFHLHR